MKIKVKGLFRKIGLVHFEFEGDEEGIKEIARETAKMLNEIQKIDEGEGFLDHCKRVSEKIDKMYDRNVRESSEITKIYRKTYDEDEDPTLPF